MTKKFTYKQVCEHIAKAGLILNGKKATPEEIFAYSLNGELSMIYIWFNEACDLIGPPK